MLFCSGFLYFYFVERVLFGIIVYNVLYCDYFLVYFDSSVYCRRIVAWIVTVGGFLLFLLMLDKGAHIEES